MKAAPASISAECPICREETLHEILTGKVAGKAKAVLDCTAKCRQCGQVHHITLSEDKPVEIPVIVSWLKDSKKASVVFGPDEVIFVDDEIMCAETPALITSIESKGARVKRCKAKNIDTIWAKKFDKIRVPFSINHQGKSYSDHVMAVPDEEFIIGDMVEISKKQVVIHSIKLENRVFRRGSALARDIVRVYGNLVRKTDQNMPRPPRFKS
ncbi:MAG: hypothetical protein KKE24_03560 [Candidatus Thermoplasmatota archaeon]|nr:hypothetical protein [Candidatus Thermoplasmatota archaeon]